MDWSARITPFPAVMTDVVNTETGKRPLADDDTMDLSRSQSGGHRYTTRSSVRASMTGTAAADSGVTELQFCGEDGSEMLAEGDQAVYDKAESTSDTTSCSEVRGAVSLVSRSYGTDQLFRNSIVIKHRRE